MSQDNQPSGAVATILNKLFRSDKARETKQKFDKINYMEVPSEIMERARRAIIDMDSNEPAFTKPADWDPVMLYMPVSRQELNNILGQDSIPHDSAWSSSHSMAREAQKDMEDGLMLSMFVPRDSAMYKSLQYRGDETGQYSHTVVPTRLHLSESAVMLETDFGKWHNLGMLRREMLGDNSLGLTSRERAQQLERRSTT